jgi:hypothetical protein
MTERDKLVSQIHHESDLPEEGVEGLTAELATRFIYHQSAVNRAKRSLKEFGLSDQDVEEILAEIPNNFAYLSNEAKQETFNIFAAKVKEKLVS